MNNPIVITKCIAANQERQGDVIVSWQYTTIQRNSLRVKFDSNDIPTVNLKYKDRFQDFDKYAN